MREGIRGILVALAVLSTVVTLAEPVVAQTSPTLTGEQLGGVPGLVPSSVDMSCSIDPATSIATFSFQATGVAVGPYPGRFGEQGTATVDTTTGQLTSLTVSQFFIVENPVIGQEDVVTGEKEFIPGFTTGAGECRGTDPSEPNSVLTAFNLRYTALLPDGTTDEGLSNLSSTVPPPRTGGSMTESFTSAEQLIGMLPSILPPGVGVGPGNSIQTKLAGIVASFQRGNPKPTCGKLGALLNEVEAQSGKQLTPAQANALSTAIKAAMAGLGC